MAVSGSIVRPFSAMPGPRRLPVLGTTLDMMSHFGKWHLLNEKRFQMYGPIWREVIPQFGDVVVIADARGVRELARAVDKSPARSETPIWVDYYKTRGLPLGIMHANGKEWQRMRKAVDKPILRPAYIAPEVPKIAQVTRDFVNHLSKLRLPFDGTVPSIDEELFKWALESSSLVLYGRRLGCLDDTPPDISTEFIQAVQDVMEQMVRLMLVPPFILKNVMKQTWHAYLKTWDSIFSIAQESVEGMSTNGHSVEGRSTNGHSVEGRSTNGHSVEGRSTNGHRVPETSAFIETVVSSQAMSLQEMYSNMSEIMLASVDTTSNSAQAVLFELGRRPDVQEKVYLEVSQHLPTECQEISYEHLSRLSYLKATIKECLRLYPVAFNVSRKLQSDTAIGGYHIPKQTVAIIALYPLGRNPDIFTDPCQLRPERWLRGEESLGSDPFGFVPFGLGQRSCVGKRIANIELELLISEIVRQFKVSTSTRQLCMTNKFLLVPESPVHVRLTPRETT